MVNMDLAQMLRDSLACAGASVVGFADMRDVAPDARQDLATGVSIGIAIDPKIVAQISDGPTKDYEAEYNRINALLDELGAECAAVLQAEGHKAVAVPATFVELDRATLSTPLPHKTAATRAGLGWIGKCALLVTEDYGSAVRLTTVLTDADLPTGFPIDESRCGSCTECIDACPGSAPSGRHWSAGRPREEIYDAFTCLKTAKSLSDANGIPEIICGMCIAACPWTKRYLSRHA